MEDTIAAVATAYGEGGIGIVRVSGEKAEEILKSIFVPSSGAIEERRLTYGTVKDPETGDIIDECMAVFMKGPHTYTTEDVAEIDCHGSVVSLRKTLSLVIRMGARLAEKGEFTKRAFLGGRLDLSQAEAVMDLVSAKTDAGAEMALDQLEGRIGKETAPTREKLLDLLTEIAVNIDYPDEDIEEVTYEKLKKELTETASMLEELLASADAGRLIREGISCAIIGRPNVGKSSLTNKLVGSDRSIVSDVAGTTRDAVDVVVERSGSRFRLVDTAGMRKKSQVHEDVEYYSMVRGLMAMDKAEVCLLVVDSSVGVTEQDQKLAVMAIERGCGLVICLNKWDLVTTDQQREDIETSLARRMPFATWAPVVRISALTGRSCVRALDHASRAAQARASRVQTSKLNALLDEIRQSGHTVTQRNRRLKLNYATQANTCPPTFTFFCNAPDLVDDNFERFMENRLRERIDLVGTPIRLKFRKKD